jgi:hypothetical protein
MTQNRSNYPSVGGFFKAALGVKATPAREREVTDELIARQARRITELERENAELRNDAERYRWLRDGELPAEYPYPVMRVGDFPDGYAIWNEELDAAIDAAKATT